MSSFAARIYSRYLIVLLTATRSRRVGSQVPEAKADRWPGGF